MICHSVLRRKLKKSFENQQRDLCREVQHASEVPENYSWKFCVIGYPMLVCKKCKKIGVFKEWIFFSLYYGGGFWPKYLELYVFIYICQKWSERFVQLCLKKDFGPKNAPLYPTDLGPLLKALFNEYQYPKCTHFKQRGDSASSCSRTLSIAFLHSDRK